jgi:hypothetical protein
MATQGIKVAKATADEFNRVRSFVEAMEALFDGRGFFAADWRDWPDDDEDKKLMRKIVTEMEYDEEDDMVVLEFVKRKFRKANFSGSFGRILFNCETLIDNCCDPELDYIEFKPSIMYAERDALEKVEAIIANGERQGLSAGRIIDDIKKRIEESKMED